MWSKMAYKGNLRGDNMESSSTSNLERVIITTTRFLNSEDEDELEARVIESDFYKKFKNGIIDKITLIKNPNLKSLFEKKRVEFENLKIPHHPVIAYHGTDSSCVDSIFSHNFDISKAKRQAYGFGHYFREAFKKKPKKFGNFLNFLDLDLNKNQNKHKRSSHAKFHVIWSIEG